MHIDSSTSPVTKNLPPSFSKRDSIFKEGYILLNTIKIHVSSTLKETANNINKKTYLTRIKAKIVENVKGKEKIVLTSCSKIVTISDTNKIFATLFNNNHIGKGKDKLIQITGAGNIKDNITIKYSNKKINALSFQYLKLSGALVIQLAKQNNIAQTVFNATEVDAETPIHNVQQNTPLVITGHTALPLQKKLTSSLETFTTHNNNNNIEISRLYAYTPPTSSNQEVELDTLPSISKTPTHNLQQSTPFTTSHTALPLKRNLISSLETFAIYDRNMKINRLHAPTLPIGTQPIEPSEAQSVSSLLTLQSQETVMATTSQPAVKSLLKKQPRPSAIPRLRARSSAPQSQKTITAATTQHIVESLLKTQPKPSAIPRLRSTTSASLSQERTKPTASTILRKKSKHARRTLMPATPPSLTKARTATPTQGKGERLQRFTRAVNYIFAHTDARVRAEHGITNDKQYIRYACEKDLIQKTSQKRLTAVEKQTLAVYKLYSQLAAENPSLNKRT